MPHPLEKLDGQKKYLFTAKVGEKEEKLFLRVVTSAKEVVKCEKAVGLLTGIITDAQADLAKELEAMGKKLKTPAPIKTEEEKQKEKSERIARSIQAAPEKFGKEDNLTYLIIENEFGDAVLVLSITINNPQIAKALNLECSHVVFHGAIIDQKYRSQGLASAGFDEMFATICAEISQRPLEIIAPVTSREVLGSDGLEEFLVHGSMYINMLRQACGDAVFLQPRLRDGWSGDYEKTRGARLNAADLTAQYLTKTMREIREEIEPSQDKSVGAFLIGDFRKNTLEFEAEKQQRLGKKQALRFEADVNKSWGKATPECESQPQAAAAFLPTQEKGATLKS